MPTALNYEADTGFMFQNRAPFSVNADPKKPPGDRFKDFVPKETPAPSTNKSGEVHKKNFMRPPIARHSEDFVSGADSEVRRRNEKTQIVELAKQLYAQEKSKRLAFEEATKILEKVQEGPEAERAKKTLSRTPPLTKEGAMERAAQQFYGLKS